MSKSNKLSKKISRTRLWFNILFPLTCYFVFAYPIHASLPVDRESLVMQHWLPSWR